MSFCMVSTSITILPMMTWKEDALGDIAARLIFYKASCRSPTGSGGVCGEDSAEAVLLQFLVKKKASAYQLAAVSLLVLILMTSAGACRPNFDVGFLVVNMNLVPTSST
uniref:Uncharacterized protein n=1 Tax=Arundo donax TaxID=35708 RepID=A0A0A9B6D7_ARUDO